MASYRHICEMCGSEFWTRKRTSRTCSHSCRGKLGGISPSKQTCACGKPASKRGFCAACSRERELAGKRRDHARHREKRLTHRRKRWREDAELRAKNLARTETRRFNGLRRERLALDEHQCQRCGQTEQLVVHHVGRAGVPRDKAMDAASTIDDLLTLCRSCHIKLHRDDLVS